MFVAWFFAFRLIYHSTSSSSLSIVESEMLWIHHNIAIKNLLGAMRVLLAICMVIGEMKNNSEKNLSRRKRKDKKKKLSDVRVRRRKGSSTEWIKPKGNEGEGKVKDLIKEKSYKYASRCCSANLLLLISFLFAFGSSAPAFRSNS